MDGAKRAVLDKAVGDIIKRYGDGSIVRLGEAQHMQTETFATGSLSLDIALGVGGIPRGRITEIYGPESAGKTTLCRAMLEQLNDHYSTALILNPVMSADELMKAIAMEFGLNVKGMDRLETVAQDIVRHFLGRRPVRCEPNRPAARKQGQDDRDHCLLHGRALLEHAFIRRPG